MDKSELELLIKNIDFKIKEYTDDFHCAIVNYQTQSGNSPFITNERTVATISNLAINEHFIINYKGKHPFFVNEFPVKINGSLSETTQTEFENDVDLKATKLKWTRCYVDGYFHVDNVYQNNEHIFVEYKMDNRFVFANLATDYLKYKILTYKCDKNSIFVYVLFDKNENYPTIIRKDSNLYSLLNKRILETDDYNSNVYLYIPNSENDIKHENNNNIVDLFKEFNILNKEIDTLNEIGEENYKIYDEKSKVLINSLSTYNKKIICSSTIRNNYPFIYELVEKLKIIEPELFKSIDEMDCSSLEKYFNDGENYRTFFVNSLLIDDKKKAYDEGLRASFNSSFALVVLLQYYCNKNDISLKNQPNFDFIHEIGAGNHKRIVNQKEVKDNIIGKLENNYHDKENREKIFNLAKKTAIYITLVYPLLFTISNENKVIGFDDNRKIHDILFNMQEHIRKIKKMTGYGKKIDLNEINNNIREELLNLALFIIEKY